MSETENPFAALAKEGTLLALEILADEIKNGTIKSAEWDFAKGLIFAGITYYEGKFSDLPIR